MLYIFQLEYVLNLSQEEYVEEGQADEYYREHHSAYLIAVGRLGHAVGHSKWHFDGYHRNEDY